MTKCNDRETAEQFIDLGDVTVETMGKDPLQAPDGTINQRFDVALISAD